METIFLKLGGSLITDKSKPHTVRHETLRRLSTEIQRSYQSQTDLQLVISHGSGSFGHVPADKYQTIQGVSTLSQWQGFVEVWREAHELNEIVIGALSAVGLPVIGFPPSASVITENRRTISWDLAPLRFAIQKGLIPVINGDVIFDIQLGGTILSTEELFSSMSNEISPNRILLAGIEGGVYKDFPKCDQLIEHITPKNYKEYASLIRGSAATDVTGGMLEKVGDMVTLVGKIPGVEVMIFSGEEDGNVFNAINGQPIGTRISR